MFRHLKPAAGRGRGRGYDGSSSDDDRATPLGRGRGLPSSSSSSSFVIPVTELSFLRTPLVKTRVQGIVMLSRGRGLSRGRVVQESRASSEDSNYIRRVNVRLRRRRAANAAARDGAVRRCDRVVIGQFDEVSEAESGFSWDGVQAIFDGVNTLGARERRLSVTRIRELFLRR